MNEITLLVESDISTIVNLRAGETKIGEVITFGSIDSKNLNLDQLIKGIKSAGKKFIIIGIEEDIGVRGNFGRPGADGAWKAFLSSFLNSQNNNHINLNLIHVLGSVLVSDLMKKSQNASEVDLRSICSELDLRVSAVISKIVQNDLIPIVIGGGHNNSYGIIKGIGRKIAVANFDLHLDFRVLEGRHSGNPFSYAYDSDLLSKYFVVGMGEQSNSSEMIGRFSDCGFKFISYEDIAIRKKISLKDALEAANQYLDNEIGLEVDLDTIANMPSSAGSPSGFTLEDACYFIDSLSSEKNILYLHLPEGAPKLGGDEGVRNVGKCLSLLTQTFIKSSL